MPSVTSTTSPPRRRTSSGSAYRAVIRWVSIASRSSRGPCVPSREKLAAQIEIGQDAPHQVAVRVALQDRRRAPSGRR